MPLTQTNIPDSPPAGLETPIAQELSPEKDSYFDFTWGRQRYDKIISEWKVVEEEAERMRVLRYIKCDKKTLETMGLFKDDETYVAVRLADQNIKAEQPQRIAYITQPRRSVILKPLGGVDVPVGLEKLEMVFTDCARYSGWERPFIRVDDGASTHGWDFVEIVFDESKPGHFALEHVGHERLKFDLESEDINVQEVLLRELKLTAGQLKKYVKEFNFVQAEVDKIIETDQKNESKTKDVLYTVHKVFFRFNNAIHVAWYGGEKTQAYLCEPVALYLGINDIKNPTPLPDGTMEYPRLAETSYPFFQLDYVISEAPRIVDMHGRCYLDEPAQTAASAILSGITNGCMRASNVYGAVAPSSVPNADSAAPKQTDVKIRHGLIYDRPITFFHTDYPPESATQALQAITTSNKSDISRPDLTVQNRKDSRKTATEVAASVADAGQMGTVQAINQSVFMRGCYTKGFEIFQNRVLQGKIFIVEELKPLLVIPYDIKSAGDVDVIQRQEKLQRQMQTWPVISQTPLAMDFLKDFLATSFPEEATRYASILDQGDKSKQLVMGLASALRIAITDEAGNIKPEFAAEAQQLQMLEQQVSEFLGVGEQAQGQEQQPANEPAAQQFAG